mgnify:CR=1 FL=1
MLKPGAVCDTLKVKPKYFSVNSGKQKKVILILYSKESTGFFIFRLLLPYSPFYLKQLPKKRKAFDSYKNFTFYIKDMANILDSNKEIGAHFGSEIDDLFKVFV